MEFYRATPIQFHSLWARHAQARDHLELLAGIMASTFANYGFASPKKALTPSDFNLGPHKRSTSSLTSAARPTSGDVNDLRTAFRHLAGKTDLQALKQGISNAE